MFYLVGHKAYHALFESRIRYGVALCGGSSKMNVQRVLIMQNHELRFMDGLDIRKSCRTLLKNWKKFTVVDSYIY